MKVAFTGTRAGMSAAQHRQLGYILAVLIHADRHVRRETEFHHGDCPEGADQEADEVARTVLALGSVHRHWPERPTARTLLARNRKLVELCDVLIAAPVTDREEVRSGTWATVRYARQAGKPVIMLSRGE